MKAILTRVAAALIMQFAIADNPKKPGKCQALAMRGGGTKGAYEVGALKAMIEALPPEDVAYDVVVGVSIGGVNAGLLAMFEIGKEAEAVDYLYELWLANPVTTIWQNWPWLGPFEGLIRSSVLDNSPFLALLQKAQENVEERQGSTGFKRGLAIQSVDLDTGEIVIFDETTPRDKIAHAIKSSASIPIFFPPELMDDRALVDGGLFTNLDLSEAVLNCREKGYDDRDIIIDVIMCFDKVVEIPQWTPGEVKYKNAYELFARKEAYIDFYYYYEDLTRVVRGYPEVEFRHLLTPRVPLEGGFVPIFDGRESIEFLLKQGEEDGRAHMEHYLEQVRNETGASPRVKTAFDSLLEFIP